MTTEMNAEKFESAKRLIVAVREANKVDDPKEFWSSLLDLFGFGYLDWLIQQTERVQELDDELTEWQTGQKMASLHYNHLRRLNIENARLREGLEDIQHSFNAEYAHMIAPDARYYLTSRTERILAGDPDD